MSITTVYVRAKPLPRGLSGAWRDMQRDWKGWSEPEKYVARSLMIGIACLCPIALIIAAKTLL